MAKPACNDCSKKVLRGATPKGATPPGKAKAPPYSERLGRLRPPPARTVPELTRIGPQHHQGRKRPYDGQDSRRREKGDQGNREAKKPCTYIYIKRETQRNHGQGATREGAPAVWAPPRATHGQKGRKRARRQDEEGEGQGVLSPVHQLPQPPKTAAWKLHRGARENHPQKGTFF